IRQSEEEACVGLVLYRACRTGTTKHAVSRNDHRWGESLTTCGLAALIPKDLSFNLSLECRLVKETPNPTPRELEILKVLWEHGPSSVRRVHRYLARFEDLAYNTVQTLLRIMEEKGLAEHHVEGRTFIYTPRYS